MRTPSWTSKLLSFHGFINLRQAPPGRGSQTCGASGTAKWRSSVRMQTPSPTRVALGLIQVIVGCNRSSTPPTHSNPAARHGHGGSAVPSQGPPPPRWISSSPTATSSRAGSGCWRVPFFFFGCHSGRRCFFLSRCHRRCRRARSYPVIRLHVIGERFTKAGRTRKALVRHLAAERGANINAADDEGTTALQAPLCVTSMHPASAGAHAHLTVNRSASEGSASGDLGVVEQQQSLAERGSWLQACSLAERGSGRNSLPSTM